MAPPVESMRPLGHGDPAPDFSLRAVQPGGIAALADYRGKCAVFIDLERAVYCFRCRRNVVLLDSLRPRLLNLGVEALVIVGTTAERAALYFRFHPTQVRVATDPELATHAAFGLARQAITPELDHQRRFELINPFNELPEARPQVLPDSSTIYDAFAALDNFEWTERDRQDMQRQYWDSLQQIGQFLVDRAGLIRWAHVGAFAAEDDILAAVRHLPA